MMPYFQNSPGLQALQLLAVAAMGLGIAWGTLLLGRLFRSRSAPFREMILKGGVCLMLGWPVVVLAGAILASVTRPEPIFVSVPNASERPLTPNPSPGGRGEPNQSVVQGRKRETVGTVWTPAENFAKTAEKTFEELFTEPSPEIGMSYTMLSLPRLVEVAIITWGLGLIVSLGFLLRDLRRVHRVRQRMVPCSHELATTLLAQVCQSIGLRHSPALLLSPDLTSPCTAGIRRPAVVLPALMLEGAIDRDALLGVLTHEVAHVRRRDVAWSLLVRFARAIYWWQYELVIIDRRLSQLREEICDNYVLLAPVDRRVYAKTLLDFAEASVMRPLVGVIGMMGKNNPLSNRIERMLAEETQPQTALGRWPRCGVWSGFLAVTVVLGIGGACAERAGALDSPAKATRDRVEIPSWTGQWNPPKSREMKAVQSVIRATVIRSDRSVDQVDRVVHRAIPLEELSGINVFFTGEEADLKDSIRLPSQEPSLDSIPDNQPPPMPNTAFESQSPESPTAADPSPIVELDVPGESDWRAGQKVIISIAMPDTNNVLPRTLRFHGLSIAQPLLSTSPEAPLSPPEIAQLEPAETPALDAIPPSPPASTPIPDQFKKIQITGGPSAVQAVRDVLLLGGVASVEACSSPDSETGPLYQGLPAGPLFRIVLDAQVDDSGKLTQIQAWGRDITSSDDPDTRLAELKAFLEEWKMAGRAARQGTPENTWDWGVILKVPDHIRYGEAQTLSRACISRGVEVHVMSNTATAKSKLRKIFTSIELSRVYDRQGKPIGTSAILLAHKSGNTDLNIITDSHWNEAFNQHARRHVAATNVLIVHADSDLPKEVLRDVHVRANRAGIEEVEFRRLSDPLEIRDTDQFVPFLMDSSQDIGPFSATPSESVPRLIEEGRYPLIEAPEGTREI